MLKYSIMKPEGILLLDPRGPLTQQDFENLNAEVNAYLAKHAKLHGVMVRAQEFPGWENWAGLSAHLHFASDHRKQVAHIALVTDSHLAGLAEFLGMHFTAAEVRHFPFAEDSEALQWLLAKIDSSKS